MRINASGTIDKDFMSFEFKNLGPIKKADINVNELTIVTGENNVGKTYLSYAIYFWFKKYKRNFIYISLQKSILEDNSLNAYISDLQKNNKITMSLNDFSQVKNNINQRVMSTFKSEISEYFNVSETYFKHFDFSMTLTPFDELKIYDESDGNEIILIKNKDYVNIEISPLADIEIKQLSIMFINLFSHYLPNSFLISAERLGIVLFRKELDARRSNIINQLQQNVSSTNKIPKKLLFNLINQFTSRYSSAIDDNINFARDMFSKREKLGIFDAEYKISNQIQKIMGGNFKPNNETNDIEFYSTKKNKKFNIPLHFSSTSVRSISMMYYYLKYKARKGDILFIDEPESNLSLNNQIELMRIIVQCVNNGIKIFLTTHSDIMLKELNNLIKYNSIGKENQDKFDIKLPYDDSMKLDHRKVSLYQIENSVTKKCIVSKKGIEPAYFDKVIDELNQISDDVDFLSSYLDE